MQTEQKFYWNAQQLSEATLGQLVGENVRFDAVCTDTRQMQENSVYIAIVGENFDGHAYVKQAVEKGAVLVLCSQKPEVEVPYVLVEDTRIALGLFGRWHRLQMPLKTVIGITGSNGKTTTKTLIAELMQQKAATLATQGNLNNDFGVPRTLLAIRPHHDFAVVEMGANHQGEIRYLTQLVKPDIALLNNAAEAHLEGFGSLQGVISGKGEIFEGLPQKGYAVLNQDSPGIDQWLTKLDALGLNNRMRFGFEQADVHILHAESSDQGLRLTLQYQQKTIELKSPLVGLHHASNIAACCAVALLAGLSWNEIVPVVTAYKGVEGRSQQIALSFGELIDDTYNANPGSVRAAIETLASKKGAKVLCLGAMAELGAYAQEAHLELIQLAVQKGIEAIYVYGEIWTELDLDPKVQVYTDHLALLHDLEPRLKDHSQDQPHTVLVKGSRSARMEVISHFLIETFTVTGLKD